MKRPLLGADFMPPSRANVLTSCPASATCRTTEAFAASLLRRAASSRVPRRVVTLGYVLWRSSRCGAVRASGVVVALGGESRGMKKSTFDVACGTGHEDLGGHFGLSVLFFWGVRTLLELQPSLNDKRVVDVLV